ncbi:hypothetical protein CK203_106898 [Vitis vinifera]|uniref:Uncharacterized protein n=1 Tax=Vitis vinifera TaxID=29760 RepID=A0A438C4H5_VITVI|nr:hypothetical protein CK203_106898 [Vitis vinifera]
MPWLHSHQLKKFGLQGKTIPLRALFQHSHFQTSAELRDSFRLLRSHDHKPGPGSYNHPFYHDGRHGILGARHIAEALHILMSQHVQRIFEPGLILPRARCSYSVNRGILTPLYLEEGAPS